MPDLDRRPHLTFRREEAINPRRSSARGFSRAAPDDVPGHARKLLEQLTENEQLPTEEGFDPRRLLKLTVSPGTPVAQLEGIRGLKVISQEDREAVVMFADERGLSEFRHRLGQLEHGGSPTRKDLLYAISGIDGWTAKDRGGQQLETVTGASRFLVDVELWALESRPEREGMIRSFESFCATHQIDILDKVTQPTIIMLRVRLSRAELGLLLWHRDVRLVDAPPRLQFDTGLLSAEVGDVPPLDDVADDSPAVVVLDSGVATGHPLLAKAIGDAQSFLAGGRGAADEHGHGTMVAGIALYGDVEACLRAGRFIPQLRLFSGRITDENSKGQTAFVENAVVEAVSYFSGHYGCKIFNLSFGDEAKPYHGGHVRGLAAVLDSLAQEYGVLFIVSAGNFHGTDEFPMHWLHEYPDYLFDGACRILDPAPALNALTVGSVARHDVSRLAGRFPNDVEYQPIARRDQLSPFTRTGPGPLGAIKPELVEYGGNLSVNARRGVDRLDAGNAILGEISTSFGFARGSPFALDAGTSYAAPRVANLAARLLAVYPDADANMLRALIVAHAIQPDAARDLLHGDADRLFRSVGDGRPDPDSVLLTDEQCVTLMASDQMSGDAHHFYEIPLPDDFLSGGRWKRTLTVALAHTPIVRRTRVGYKGSALSFKVVREPSLDQVARVFTHATKGAAEPMMNEYAGFSPGAELRSKGTVQAGTKVFTQVDARWGKNRLFVVVTRHVEPWAATLFADESYSL
ncbi:MAG: S8 family peptidase, partial [Sulfobacillus sp.]